MKNIFLLFVLLAAVVITPSQTQTSNTGFSSRLGFFTVRIPGYNPREELSNDGYSSNGSLISIDRKTTYVVEYKCYCDRIDKGDGVSQRFTAIIATLQSQTGGTVVSQKDLVLNG